MEQDYPETTELIDDQPEATPEVDASPEPERRNPAEERIAELIASNRRLEETLAMTQQMQREQLARSAPPGPTNPRHKEFSEHEFTAYLEQRFAQQVQAATLPILDRQDRTDAELAVTKKYGEETWDKLKDDVEQEHQSYLQRGQWAEREKLVYLVAGKKNVTLTERAKQRESEQRDTRRRSARSAAVETGSPVRRADSTPPPPLHTMEKSKRDAALSAFLAKTDGF